MLLTSFPLTTFYPPHGATAPRGPGPPHYRGFTLTLRTPFGKTPLDNDQPHTETSQYTTLTKDRRQYHRRGSNPQSQTAGGRRHQPSTQRNYDLFRILRQNSYSVLVKLSETLISLILWPLISDKAKFLFKKLIRQKRLMPTRQIIYFSTRSTNFISNFPTSRIFNEIHIKDLPSLTSLVR